MYTFFFIFMFSFFRCQYFTLFFSLLCGLSFCSNILHTSFSFSIFYFCSSLVIFCGVSIKDVSIMLFIWTWMSTHFIKCISFHTFLLSFFFLPFLSESTLRGIPNPVRLSFSRDITVFFKRILLVLKRVWIRTKGNDFNWLWFYDNFSFCFAFLWSFTITSLFIWFNFRFYLFTGSCTSSWYLFFNRSHSNWSGNR